MLSFILKQVAIFCVGNVQLYNTRTSWKVYFSVMSKFSLKAHVVPHRSAAYSMAHVWCYHIDNKISTTMYDVHKFIQVEYFFRCNHNY